jgi:Glycosyl transferase family 2
MSSGFKVVAIIAAYNEADIIDAVLRGLIDEGVSVYFIDDGSTDGTVEAVEAYAGLGVIGIERRRGTDSAGPEGFAWEQILRRKAQLTTEIEADWFIHHDADEFRESPWAGVTLKDAIERVDAMGYNAIDFESLDFHPTDDRFRSGNDVRSAFPFYSKAAPHDRLQIRCWKKTSPVDLASSGGHEAKFADRRVFPIRFISRHYPIRTQAHGERKVFLERQPRFADSERARGWHVQYADVAEGTSFVRDPGSLARYDPVDVRIRLGLRHRDVEALEESVGTVRAALQAVRSDVESRTREVELLNEQVRIKVNEKLTLSRSLDDVTNELHARRDEVAALKATLKAALERQTVESANLRAEVANRKVDVVNLRAALTDCQRRLDAFQRSLSWRWTAPARAVYRLFGGA